MSDVMIRNYVRTVNKLLKEGETYRKHLSSLPPNTASAILAEFRKSSAQVDYDESTEIMTVSKRIFLDESRGMHSKMK